jgi:hypothetical protein
VDQARTLASAERTEDPNECGGPSTGEGTACPDGNPNWEEPVLFRAPRTLCGGTRLSWQEGVSCSAKPGEESFDHRLKGGPLFRVLVA